MSSVVNITQDPKAPLLSKFWRPLHGGNVPTDCFDRLFCQFSPSVISRAWRGAFRRMDTITCWSPSIMEQWQDEALVPSNDCSVMDGFIIILCILYKATYSGSAIIAFILEKVNYLWRAWAASVCYLFLIPRPLWVTSMPFFETGHFSSLNPWTQNGYSVPKWLLMTSCALWRLLWAQLVS